MANMSFTLTDYGPVYVTAPEVKIPEEEVRRQAKRWLELNACKDGEEPKLTDKWVDEHVEEVKNVDELLVHIRFNMYKNNREVQKLADQDVICKELATRLVEELPEDLVEMAKFNARMRFEEMCRRSGMQVEDFCKQRGQTPKQVYADVDYRAVESLKEDSALQAYADKRNYTLTPEDYYAVIPGDSIEDKAYKRRQIELDGRMPGLEDYAIKTKALNEVMDNAMIRRSEEFDYERYGDVSKNVMDAYSQSPENFISL